MLKARTVGTMLCVGALAALPACSTLGGMFGGNEGGGQHQSAYNRPAYSNSGYGSSQSAMQQTAQPGTSVTREAAVTPRTIRAVQRKLKHENLDSARVDGVWGPKTEHGLREWQERHNENATGQLDVQTLQAMNIGPGNNQQYGESNGSNQPNGNNNPSYGMNNGSNGMNNQASGENQANRMNQPNYSTAGNHRNDSSYSSNNANNGDMTNIPQGSQQNANPPGNGATGNGTGTGGTGQPGH